MRLHSIDLENNDIGELTIDCTNMMMVSFRGAFAG
jgi:hypothetical protein